MDPGIPLGGMILIQSIYWTSRRGRIDKRTIRQQEGETMRARDILRREYGSNSKNFMTPHVLEVGSIWRGKVAYEISQGKGIRRDWNSPEPDIFGVSVASYNAELDTTQRHHDPIGGCFGSLDAARDHVNFLRENWWEGEADLLDAIARRKVIGG